jgi:hypothetical protein
MLFTVANLPFDSPCFTMAVVSLFILLQPIEKFYNQKKHLETLWETGPKVFSRTVLNIFRSVSADSLGQCFLVGVGIGYLYRSRVFIFIM